MLFQEVSDRQENRRRVKTFRNTQTGTEVKTSPIYTDASGVEWWAFIDLFKIPYIRTAYAKHLMDLFTMGLSLKDILNWCEAEKELLKGNDPEKYEKLYALVLEKEKLAKHTADPIKQHMALCSVYVMQEGERIDYFDETLATEKLRLWGADRAATAFFLNWHIEAMQRYFQDFKEISRTVSKFQEP